MKQKTLAFRAVYGENLPILPPEAGAVQKYTDKDWDATSASEYLPRIQLMIANSEPCKSGDFPINHYALVQNANFQDLGQSVDLLVIAWRPKALELGENIISVFDPESPEFKRIQEHSTEANSGCMFGPEFLVWIPSANAFATFLMGSKSARREAGNMKLRLQKAATLKSKKIETAKFSWFAPVVTPCSAPIDLPNLDELRKVVEKFNNPPQQVVETAEEGTGESRAR